MRVVVNQLAALGQKTGIGHYTSQLLRCLHDCSKPGEVEAYPEGLLRSARETFTRVRPYLEGSRSAGPGPAAANQPRFRWRARAVGMLRQVGRAVIGAHFRLTCAQKGFTLYHETNFIPLPCDKPTIATIHDLSVLLHPEWHPIDRVRHFEKHFHAGLSRCVHYLAISEYARQEIIQTLHLPPEKVTRTYMGIRPGLGPRPESEVYATLRRLNLPERYLLYLGTIEPRKNVLTLLRAYCALPEKVRSRWPLLLVGGWGWNTEAVSEYYHAVAKHRGVQHVGYVADADVAALYTGARALAYPSIYEGFGLPPIEMMACGGAVLAGTAGAIVETVGRKADLIPPRDLDGWRQALLRVVTDDDWWQHLRTGVEDVARPYTWDACAADTLRAYQLVAGELPAKREYRAAG
ncbi:glycosyltransferase family 1 protein [soil metagenome]